MEKVAEKIGLYDLWALFFPGTIGMIELTFLGATFYCIYIKESLISILNSVITDSISLSILWLLLSIFVGIILQEIGRGIGKIVKFKNATGSFLNPNGGIFSEAEIHHLTSFLTSYGWDGTPCNDSSSFFHIINANAQKNGTAAKYVKLSVLQAMSFSFSSAMLIGAIISTILLFYSIINSRITIMALMIFFDFFCILLMIIFYKRAKRYNTYWVRNLLFAMSTDESGSERSGHE